MVEKLEEYGIKFLEKLNVNFEISNYQNFDLENLEDNLSEVTLFKINELTFEENEKNPRREAFENVLGTLRVDGINFIYLILGSKKGVSFYFGIVKNLKDDRELPLNIREMGETLLKASIHGNFRGSKIEKLTPKANKDILNKIKSSKRFGTIVGIPGINESEDKSSFQGIDRLTDVMLGDEFGLCILAKPVDDLQIKNLEKQLYKIYDKLSIFSKKSIQTGVNNSQSTGETKGKSISESKGTSITLSTSIGESETISKGTNSSKSFSKGKTESKTEGSNRGKNASYSETNTKGVSETFSNSKGSSENKSEGKSWNSSSGTSESLSKGISETFSNSKGSNENKSKGKTSGSSSGTSESLSKGVSETFSNSKGSSENKSEGKSWSSSSGTSESLSKGISETITESTGKNEGESFGKTSGSSESKGETETTTTGTNDSTTSNESIGTSYNISTEVQNREIQDWLKYLDEILFPIIDYGKSKGIYLTSSFVFSNNRGTLIKLGNTMKSLFSGRKGNKIPLTLELLPDNDKRIEFFQNFQIPEYDISNYTSDKKDALILKSGMGIERKAEYGNWYSANELSLIAGLPQKEVVGLSLKEEVEFGLNVNSGEDDEKILLGNLVQSGNILDIDVSLDKKALNKHIFITGVTGTGKTTTCQKLLLESEMPFLVIEPAKTEYRILIDEPKTKDILIFTLGKDTVSPFRLNPFEFFKHETITSRVDMLKAAMEASFDMEAAIPQLLESSMYECYKDYGWNILTNKNSKFEDPFAEGIYSFPTLKDLLDKVEVEVEKQGFDDRLKRDYIGSIKARLQGLLVGSKGIMLNVGRGIDFRELIERKVVLEIEEIKNGSEKSLIMGFVLTNLCEALKAKYKENRHFKHITLIEEAHRLLAKFTPGDSPNRKQGIETFTDMLAEVRKYGESLIIADQIPNKLTPEILKNTNTKIVHKLFAEDDKEAIGTTMSLSSEQKDFLSSLNTGRAIVFSQGWDKALQVQIKMTTNTTGDRYVEDSELTERIIDFYQKNNIILGLRYLDRKATEEEFEYCKLVSSYQKEAKIFKELFENKIKTFEQFKIIFNILLDEDLWNIMEKILLQDGYDKISEKNGREFVEEIKKMDCSKDIDLNIFKEIILGKYYDKSQIREELYKDISYTLELLLKNILAMEEYDSAALYKGFRASRLKGNFKK